MIGANGHHSNESGPSFVEGTVQSRNERGIRVDGDWFNVSKFKPVELPEIGARVRLGLDAKGFITSLEVVQATGGGIAPSASERDTRISRLAVLKAAAMFGASRSDLKSGDVLRIADTWLQWVEGE